MRVVSIPEPFVSYIVKGKATVAMRTSKTAYRGDVLICGSQSPQGPYASRMACIVRVSTCRKMHYSDNHLAGLLRPNDFNQMLGEDGDDGDADLEAFGDIDRKTRRSRYLWVLRDLRVIQNRKRVGQDFDFVDVDIPVNQLRLVPRAQQPFTLAALKRLHYPEIYGRAAVAARRQREKAIEEALIAELPTEQGKVLDFVSRKLDVLEEQADELEELLEHMDKKTEQYGVLLQQLRSLKEQVRVVGTIYLEAACILLGKD